VTQPLDRTVQIKAQGKIDHAAGEFWVENPFSIGQKRLNLSAYEPNQLFLNLQGQGFVNLSHASGADTDSDSRSVITADFDRDGDVDLLVANVGGGPLQMYRNQIPQHHHRVRIALEGTQSNKLAIGTRLIATCGEQKIVRDVFAPNGFMGQSPPELTLGVGTAEVIDTLMIRWPNGDTQEFTDLPVDCQISLREGDEEFKVGKLFLN